MFVRVILKHQEQITYTQSNHLPTGTTEALLRLFNKIEVADQFPNAWI